MKNIFRPLALGLAGALALLSLYFGIVTLVSGWEFAKTQFSSFWYFIIPLAGGFGVQVGLYTYLKTAIREKNASGKVLAVSGATSTAAMISCCAHYLANILPILAASGFATLIGQYQVELFWVGLLFNALGIAYIANRVISFRRHV